jgi:O-Antigen ligase
VTRMSAPASLWNHSPWVRVTPRYRGAARYLRAAVIAVAAGVLTALAVRYAPVPRLLLIMVPVGLGVAFLVFASPFLAAVLLGAAIPEIQDVTGGHIGLHVAASDVLLVLVVARLLAVGVTGPRLGVLRAVRTVAFPFGQYAWLILILLVLHPGFGSVVKSVQRIELFVFPLLAGAYLALRRDHVLVLRAFVIATTLLAVAWPVLNSHGLGGQFQKNPTGQVIVGAILLLVAVRGLRRLLPCLPLLLIGLALTASRGALLALAVGLVVLSIMYGGRRRRAIVARTLAVVLIGASIYPFLPGDVTSRLASYTTTTGAAGSYAIDIREAYDRDAEQLISEHPWTGVGVGNYLAGSADNLTQTTDPHEVILLEAAEGGYLFAASFICLIAGTAFALWRLRRVELAAAAAAVLLATAAHGLVDVYWVRGTPILGFLLVGMVCGLAAQRRRDTTA